jgi:RNA polymerase sigma-70 factor (ECF subfamily)
VIAATIIKNLRGSQPVSTELIDDLVQDTYLRIWKLKALQAFRSSEPKSIYGFIQSIAFSVVQDHLRSVAARKRGAGMARSTLDGRPAAASGDDVMERRVLLRELEEMLCEIAPLPRDQAVFLLHYRQGMTAKAIAELPGIGLTSKGVESLLYRLKEEMRRRVVASARQSTLQQKGSEERNPS